jgi:VIT1/CCC1 family predicted Fe2+/Mn2+ transporter
MKERLYYDKDEEEASGNPINGALNNLEPANDYKNNFTTTTADNNEGAHSYEHRTALGEAEVRTGNIQNDLDNTRKSREADDNSNENTISREERSWIDKQKQTIHAENATRDNTHEEEHSIHTNDKDAADELPFSYHIPDADRIEDATALSVMIYLLVIAFLLAIAILIGTVVVSQYGFVVLVAVILAVGAMLLVLLVVISVISGDRKLTKARSQIHKWSMEVKDVIMKEVADIKEDWNDFSSGMLLLTYEGELDMSSTTSDYVRDDFDNKENSNSTKSKRKRRKPKSIMFRLAVTPLKKLSRKHHNNQGSIDGKKRRWFRKKKTNVDGEDDKEGPNNNYYVPPSENFEVI